MTEIDMAQMIEYRNEMEKIRQPLLAETDLYGLSDVTMTSEMTAYRQALRDIPDQAGFPIDITWPTKPDEG